MAEHCLGAKPHAGCWGGADGLELVGLTVPDRVQRFGVIVEIIFMAEVANATSPGQAASIRERGSAGDSGKPEHVYPSKLQPWTMQAQVPDLIQRSLKFIFLGIVSQFLLVTADLIGQKGDDKPGHQMDSQ